MDSSAITALITVLAALISAAGSIIVAIIQSSKDKPQQTNGIYLPSNVVLHRPKTQIRWLTVLSFAFLGGIVGYGVAIVASPKSLPNQSFTPTAIGTSTSSPNSTAEIVPSPTTDKQTLTPSPSVLNKYFLNGCVPESIWHTDWTETNGDISGGRVATNGCYGLFDWGLTAQENGLLILKQNTNENQLFGIYTTIRSGMDISTNADITFTVGINELSATSEIRFGIAPTNMGELGAPLSQGVFLVVRNGEFALIEGDYEGREKLIESYKPDDFFQYSSYNLRFDVNDDLLTIYLDNSTRDRYSTLNRIDKVFTVKIDHFFSRSFWIVFKFPKGGGASALISGFSLQEK